MPPSLFLLPVLWALAAPAQPAPAPAPFQARVDDPLLAPAPAARLRVATWDEALALLRRHSTDLSSAAAEVERAQGRWRQSLATLLPNARLSASGLYDVLNPDTPPLAGVGGAAQPGERVPTTPLGTASATLTQSVVDVGGWRGLSSAAASRRSASATLEDVRRRLTQGLARSLVAVVTAERVAELNRLGLRLALERAALTQRTLELGAGTQLDVLRVQQDVTVARGALISGDEQLVRTREALALALGVEGELGVSPTFGLAGLVAATRRECSALPPGARRADVEAASEGLEAARESRRQASAGYLPTLGLTSSLFGFTTTPGPGEVATWSIGAVLSLPLWEGGGRGGLVRERAGAETQAADALEDARRLAALEVAQAQRGVPVAEALLEEATRARTVAAQLDQLTRRSFEVGRSTSLELVQSAAALRQAELDLALREFELVQARLDAILTEARCNG